MRLKEKSSSLTAQRRKAGKAASPNALQPIIGSEGGPGYRPIRRKNAVDLSIASGIKLTIPGSRNRRHVQI
jgi:hypothetical protein